MSAINPRLRIRRLVSPLFLSFAAAALLSACDSPGPDADSLGQMDSFSIASATTLRRPAPGVLANDRNGGEGLTAQLAFPPKFGDVTLEPDGSFVYVPKYKFTGRDFFTYTVSDGDVTSEPIPVQIAFPNVIVILVDDMGQGDVSAYNPRAVVKTPNIDALAAAGIAFNHAHSTAALCSPARYSALTGNHPYRGRNATGVWGWNEPATMILPGQATLGDIFSEADYQTAFIGKTHNGAAFWNIDGNGYTRNPDVMDFSRNFDGGPTQFGFDYSFVLPSGLSGPPYTYFENDRMVRFNEASEQYEPFATNAEALEHFVEITTGWGQEFNGGLLGGKGIAMDNYASQKVGGVITGKALEFLGNAIDANQSVMFPEPFFLFFAPPQLHTPYSPPEFFNVERANYLEQADEGDPVAGTTNLPRSDVVREIDLMVGEIVRYLENRGQLDNTLIVFSSDNGPLIESGQEEIAPQGSENGAPLRGYKGHIYEGGHRVPLVARWGDGASRPWSTIAPGSQSNELLGLHDLASTFYALLGQQRPFNQANDSKSFLPVLLANRKESDPVRDHLIIQGGQTTAAKNDYFINRAFYKRDTKGDLWKLAVISSNTDPLSELTWGELFNLSSDPGESTDLAARPDKQALVASMKSEYLELIAQPQTVLSFR